jgi:SAM-dependent methyltransferase
MVAREIAGRAIAAYSDPADLIIDPDCADGGELIVEAIRQGRHVIALTGSARQASALRTRLARAKVRGAAGDAELVHCPDGQLPSLLARDGAGLLARHRACAGNVSPHPCGSFDLIVARASTGAPGRSRLREQLLGHCAALLRPGGFLILTQPVRTTRVDDSRASVRVGQQLRLQYWQHVIALLAPIREGRLDPPSDLVMAGPGEPRVVHADLHVFRKPAPETAVGAEAEPA